MTDKEKLHQILSSLWKNDDSVGKTYYNQTLQDVQTAIDLQEEPVSEDLEKIVEEIAEPTILNAYGTKELARRLRNTICGTSVSEDLEEASKNYALNNTPWDDCKDEIQEAYKAGYHQAEKDLELSWEDIKLIWNITDEMDNMPEEEFYREVLKRFKEKKEE